MNPSATHSVATLNAREAARFLGFSTSYLRQKRMRNEGPPFLRIGTAVRYCPEDLTAWLAAHRVETRGRAGGRCGH